MGRKPEYSKIGVGFDFQGETEGATYSLFISTEKPLGEVGARRLQELGVKGIKPDRSIYTA